MYVREFDSEIKIFKEEIFYNRYNKYQIIER